MGNAKLAQRTMVVTCGALAGAAGSELAARLVECEGPREIVAIRSLSAAVDTPEVIAASLHDISQVTIKEQLARQGWQVDRLDELALFLVLDAIEAPEMSALEATIGLITERAQRVLGVSTAVLCLALFPQPDDDGAEALLGQLVGLEAITRGVIALGLTNAVGLRLPDTSALVKETAVILYALMTAPLRDAPERLAAQQQPGRPGTSFVLSAGLAEWRWPYEWEKKELTRRWLLQILSDWLREAPAEYGPSDVDGWLADQEMEPEQLARRLSAGGQLLLSTPRLATPQPWRLRSLYHSLSLPDESGNEADIGFLGESRYQVPLCQAQAQLSQELNEALTVFARQLLDKTPVRGLARLALFLEQLPVALLAREDLLAGRQAIQAEQIAALAEQRRRIIAEIEERLGQWPADTWPAWLKVSIRPWCWPRLVWKYRQLSLALQALVSLTNQWRGWCYEEATATAVEKIYDVLRQEAGRLQNRVEEVGDMLGYARQSLATEQIETPDALPETPDYFIRRLSSLVEERTVEANWAATAVGGLARQLKQLDEQIIDELRRQGEMRIGARMSWTVVDTLLFLYPEAGELALWWTRQWEAAAPLWRFDQAAQPEATGVREVTFVCAAGVEQLQQRLKPAAEIGPTLWFPGAGFEIVILRLCQQSTNLKESTDGLV